MGLGKKHDITDIYGVRGRRSSPLTSRGDVEAPETGFRHSGRSHKYFRGYTEIRRLAARGRVTVERCYTRPWIVSALSGRQYWLVRLLYALLTAASAALFLAGLAQRIPGNSSWVVALPGYAGALLLFLLAAVTLRYIFTPRRMTLWDHAASTARLKRFALLTAAAQALTAAALAGFALATRQEVPRSLACAGLILLSAAFSAALFVLERRMPYTEIPNDTKCPPGEAHEIW